MLREAEAPAAKSSGRKVGVKSSASSTKAVRELAVVYTAEQKVVEARLREWRKAEAAKTGKPSFLIFSDTTLHALVAAQPRSLSSLLQVSGIGSEKAERYGAAIIALITGVEVPLEFGEPASIQAQVAVSKPKPAPRAAARERGEPAPKRERGASVEESLTGEQQVLDQRLREWRKAESEKLGLPQFFVLGSSALRSIVLERPRTLRELEKIDGIDAEKIDKYGAGILRVCSG
jgi:ATP-dependent DNA helicase RecQ